MSGLNSNVGHSGPHDLGGVTQGLDPSQINLTTHKYQFWERKIDATQALLSSKKLMNVAELRRGIEALDTENYNSLSYFEKWAVSLSNVVLERKVLSQQELDEKLGPPKVEEQPHFKVGDRVKVKQENTSLRWRKPHLRTPGYIFEKEGVIERYCGKFDDPEVLAYRGKVVKLPLYRVTFQQTDLWKHYEGSSKDTIDVEIFQTWLSPVVAGGGTEEVDSAAEPPPAKKAKHEHVHSEHGEASHDHGDHVHEERGKVEQTALEREGERSPVQHLADALVAALLEKGVFTNAELTEMIEYREMRNKKLLGAKLVARAWTDPKFKERLLEDGNAALKELLDMEMEAKLVVVENSSEVHNVIVCTLCSCYPGDLLGHPPDWYKSRSYRALVPLKPREILQQFGTKIDDQVSIKVHDSSADCRYLVLPMRPQGTEGLSEEDLIQFISRDSMVGVRLAGKQNTANLPNSVD